MGCAPIGRGRKGKRELDQAKQASDPKKEDRRDSSHNNIAYRPLAPRSPIDIRTIQHDGRQQSPVHGNQKHSPRALLDGTHSPPLSPDRRHGPIAFPKRIEALDQEAFKDNIASGDMVDRGTPFETIASYGLRPPRCKDMRDSQDERCFFMIRPFSYDPSHPDRDPESSIDGYQDRWDTKHVCMPCSPQNVDSKRRPIWDRIEMCLTDLKRDCDTNRATFKSLQKAIEGCNDRTYDMKNLEILINRDFSKRDREAFLSTTLSNMCTLVLNIRQICGQAPPLLGVGSDRSVTMSQRQAASLLACAFFCLFPFRSNPPKESEYAFYPDPNFQRLYQSGSPKKIEKVRCILHYFERISEKMPTGVITFRRRMLSEKDYPAWEKSKAPLSYLHLTSARRIEDINGVLQADFANKFIGGGVLGEGCVQEEIRFSICPEMLVSLLLCERMEDNECIFLIGCERFSKYKGYADSFQFAEDFRDETIKDSWGRKWCHVVAMDAIFFRNPSTQYAMKNIDRELIKAYTSFLPVDGTGPNDRFGIATGNWGCGAFNGEKQLKALIQLLAASAANRPLVYAAFGDRRLVESFAQVYNYLCKQNATVGDLYAYLQEYSRDPGASRLFEMIQNTSARSPPAQSCRL